mmetsp:Transcript_64478/g.171390  ORF Transcript_64478/g.171390 Transcript_64478/m.171390 type:complete len:133 (-) Transcript_64478:1510-1908(-)
MPTGKVKMFDEDKGFGFIEPEDGGNDIFVHRKVFGSDRGAYLNKGDTVTYEVEWDDRKGKYCASKCTGFRSGGGGGGGGGYGGGGGGGGRGRSRSRSRGAERPGTSCSCRAPTGIPGSRGSTWPGSCRTCCA